MPLIAKSTGIKDQPITAIERVAKKFTIDAESGCWLWTAGLNESGYGQCSVAGKSRSAHRTMWELAGGTVISHLQLDHLCRVRNCVNPKHLEQVSARVNTMRGLSVAALAALKTHCAKGHPLTEDNVYVVKKKYQRVCATCRREWVREHRYRNRCNIVWGDNGPTCTSPHRRQITCVLNIELTQKPPQPPQGGLEEVSDGSS